jgi:hypothetical protein
MAKCEENMKRLLTFSFLTAILFSSCTESGEGMVLSDPENPDTANDSISISTEPTKALIESSVPLIWDGYYWEHPNDSIIAGSSDTASCDIASENEETYYWPNVTYSPVYTSAEAYEESITLLQGIDLLYPKKILEKDELQMISDLNRGVHFYDKRDPANPEYLGFLYAPGALDMSIKNDILYVNSYSNLLAISIEEINDPKLEKVVQHAFPPVYKYAKPMISEEGGVAIAWKADTTWTCEGYYYDEYMVMEDGVIGAPTAAEATADGSSNAERQDTFGQTGSMSRFAINSDYLYAVDQYQLRYFDVSSDNDPVISDSISVEWGLETTFLTEEALFVGARTGMHIFALDASHTPSFASTFTHMTSCDPVVVEGDLAFVTLSSGNSCFNGDDELNIIDISDLENPTELATYEMQNPQGLSVNDSLLHICEGDYGFKTFDIASILAGNEMPDSLSLLSHLENFHAYDVIANSEEVSIIGNDGLYRYDFSDPENPELLSHEESTGEFSDYYYPMDDMILIEPAVEPVLMPEEEAVIK